MHEGFDFWIEGVDDVDAEARASMERANAAGHPDRAARRRSRRPTGAGCATAATCAGSCPRTRSRCWTRLARLHGAGGLSLGEGTRYVGAFRAHGLLVPVWDLPHEAEADAVEGPAAGFRARLDQALALTAPLTDAERRARNGLLSRQLTLR